MKKVMFLLFCFQVFTLVAEAQDSTGKKGEFYLSVGWHRAWYTRSTVQLTNAIRNYDLTFFKVRSHDDNDLNIGHGIDAPQWSARIGYSFAKGWGVEIGYDHAKYVLTQGQHVRMRGRIGQIFYDNDTLLREPFIRYEHTDGANYFFVSLIKKKPLDWMTRRKAAWLWKVGAGPAIPRTNSLIMGRHYDDTYHVSGYVVQLENSLRLEIVKRLFAELALKIVYVNFTDVLIHDDGHGEQRWGTLMPLFTITYVR